MRNIFPYNLIILPFFVGPSKISFANIPGKEKSAWGIPLGTDAHYTSSDASLFSSSLPVLPHEKRKHEQGVSFQIGVFGYFETIS